MSTKSEPVVTSKLEDARSEEMDARSYRKKQQMYAQVYNRQRSIYNQAVSTIRKQYAEEIRVQVESQKTQEEELRAAILRARLQRQRLKNIQSAKNALRHEQEREKQKILFQEKIKQQQVIREKEKQLTHQARALALVELEKDAKYWMSTVQEVEEMFATPSIMEVEQKLWARPGGYLGSPNPSIHDEFWRFESHTWDMSKTYPSPRDLLLEDLQEFSYQQANMPSEDPTSPSSRKTVYWTQERVLAQDELEEKAKLRALVREEGRKALLLQQRQRMQDDYALKVKELGQTYGLSKDVQYPLELPSPTLDILGNYQAMEREGVKLLEAEPERFFVFDSTVDTSSSGGTATSSSSTARSDSMVNVTGGNDDDETKDVETTASIKRALGRPIALRDPIRDTSPTRTPYPQLVGRLLKPDTRTEREKKRDEKQEKMWAAANATLAAAGKVDVAADDDLKNVGGPSEPMEYNIFGNRGDEEDVAWEQSLMREVDDEKDREELLQTPRDQRYSEEDIDWIIGQLEKRIQALEDILKFEEDSARRSHATKGSTDRQDGISQSIGVGNKDATLDDDPVVQALGQKTIKSVAIDERGREYTSYTVVDEDDHVDAKGLDFKLEDYVDIKAITSIMDELSTEQIAALEVLGQERDLETMKKIDDAMSETEMRNILSKVPGLSEAQIQSLLDLENSLSKNAPLLDKLGIKNK